MAAFIGVPISFELANQLKDCYLRVRNTPHPIFHAIFVTKTFIAVTDACNDYSFHQLAEKLENVLDPEIRAQKATWGKRILNMSLKVIESASNRNIRKTIHRLSDEQMLKMIDFSEETLIEVRGQPYVGMAISEGLAIQIHDIIDQIRKEPPPSQHIPQLLKVQLSLIDAMIEFSFLEASRRIGLKPMTIKLASVGVALVDKVFHGLLRKLMPTMEDAQVLVLADHLEASLFR